MLFCFIIPLFNLLQGRLILMYQQHTKPLHKQCMHYAFTHVLIVQFVEQNSPFKHQGQSCKYGLKVKNTLLATNSFMLLSLFHKTVSSTAHVYMFQTLKKLAQGNGNAILFSSCHCLYCCHHSRGMIEHHPLIVSVLSWHLRWSCPSWKDHPPHLWQMEQVLPVACFCLFLRSLCLVQTWMIK